MSMTLSLDHIILPKTVTDDLYATWNTYYGELFPSPTKPSPTKPRYRPLSKMFTTSDDENITKSSPDLLEAISSSEDIQKTGRVGDNIDEFIRTNRSRLVKSTSTNYLLDEFEKQKSLGYFESEKSNNLSGIMRKQDVKSNPNTKRNRISWCGVQDCLNTGSRIFMGPLGYKKNTYECIDTHRETDTVRECVLLEEYSIKTKDTNGGC